MSEVYGYLNVSTQEKQSDRQLEQLTAYGIAKKNIIKEKMSGTKKERLKLNELLAALKEGDLLVICEVNRISKNARDLLATIDKIRAKGVNIKSLNDTWLDTTSENPNNSFLLTVIEGLRKLDKGFISKKTSEGLKVARARGREGGRPRIKQEDIDRALMLYDMGVKISDILNMCNMSKNTLYVYIRKRKSEVDKI